ncbi:response regulator receiver and ANTAR domain protein [Terracoccus luteus]|uniref:Response regulator receiver and ANTAR domain protein n=1 Tax=Terracoccus luteus TaxID=53356 RepID=A0A495XW27_9MICO|nr:response regulator receiver and ANTAR domain protein [Terracoccus luteus]
MSTDDSTTAAPDETTGKPKAPARPSRAAKTATGATDTAAPAAPAGEPTEPTTPTAAESPDAGESSGASASGGTRILVAEDETLIRLDLVEMLGELGYDVVGQASNGEQAVELARELKPDLVIMDVKMPIMDGLSAAEALHETKLCPVIMLTAFSQTELVERARDAGVMAYVVKPFTADDLRPAIDIAHSRWQEMKALESEIADLGERLETRKLVDRAKGTLMTQLKLSEADAFRWIQKTAMDRRLGMKEVAEAVINGFPAS